MLIGYARVSTEEQDTDMQIRLLKAAGATLIFSEKASSIGHRPELAKALAKLQKGDVLLFYKLDRLARSMRNLLDILAKIETAQAQLRSLTEPLDTTTPVGRMFMMILGCIAEFERALIHERTKSGLEAAKARGTKLGRRRQLDPFDEADMVNMYLQGWYTMRILAEMFDCSVNVVKRAIYRRTRPSSSSLA